MKLENLDLNKTYTYADYLTWAFEETVELIKGKIFKMSPAPNTNHQDISSNFRMSFPKGIWPKSPGMSIMFGCRAFGFNYFATISA